MKQPDEFYSFWTKCHFSDVLQCQRSIDGVIQIVLKEKAIWTESLSGM